METTCKVLEAIHEPSGASFYFLSEVSPLIFWPGFGRHAIAHFEATKIRLDVVVSVLVSVQNMYRRG